MAGKSSDVDNKGLIKTMKSLEENTAKIARFYETKHYLWMGFFRGILYGLGIIVAIAIVLPLILTLLSTIDWIPYIGEIVTNVITRLKSAQPY